MLAVGTLEQVHPEQGSGRQIEADVGRGAQRPPQLDRVEIGRVDLLEADLHSRLDALHRAAVAHREGGAQRPVTVDEALKRASQKPDVDR